MKKIKFYGNLVLPIIISFIPFGIAIGLVSRGEEPTAILAGLLTPSIIALFILIRQRRNDYDRKEAIQRRRNRNYKRRK